MNFERYAIYWAPPKHSALANFGERWLGSDVERGRYARTREHFGVGYALSCRAVASPRRYCLHATLKAPFRLREGVRLADLCAELAAFCARRRRFEAGPLRLRSFNGWLALMPDRPLADLEWLAAECVTHFDRFRAPLNDKDRARRGANLSPVQAALMESFGYPYALSEFFFHVTLAGPLGAAELADVRDALAPICAPFAAEPLAIEGICLFGDPGGADPFRLIERFPLLR